MLVFAVVGLALASGAFAQQIDGSVGGEPKAEKSAPEPPRHPQPPDLTAIENLINRIAGAIEAQNQNADADHERDRAIRDVDAQEAMAFWAAAMTWATVGGVVVGFASLILLALTVYYAREASKAAFAAAATAESSVQKMEIAAQAQLRAYVFMNNVNSIWTAKKETEEIQSWTFTPVWKNHGQTPTVSAATCVSYAFATNEIDAPVALEFADQAAPSRSMYGPNAVMFAERYTISIEQARLLYDRKARAFVWGWVDYNDVFPGTERHRTEFCFEIVAIGNPIYKSEPFAYRAHGRFNGHDTECHRKPIPILKTHA